MAEGRTAADGSEDSALLERRAIDMKRTMWASVGLVAILALALIAGCDEKAEEPA